MGQTLSNLLTSPISFIDQRVGDIISGAVITAFGVVTGNPAVVAFGLQRLAGGIAGKPRPDLVTTSAKQPRPTRVSAYGISRLFGAYILYDTASNGTAVDIYAMHDGQMDGVVGWYLNDELVTLSGEFVNEGTDKRYAGNKLSIHWTDGSTPGVAIAPAVGAFPGIWTTNHRGDGVVVAALFCVAVKSDKFIEIYPNGVPSLSMAARWQKCPDFNAEDPSDESGWTWTENPIRQLGHYKLVREGIDYATKIAPTLEYWQAAQDVCDEAVALKAGGTEPRWRSCVAHKHTDPHKAVNTALMATCDGWIAPRADGALTVFAGKFIEPTISIGPDQIISYEWDGVGVDDDSAANEIVVSYVSSLHTYNSVETDPWVDEDDIAERGVVLSTSLEAEVPSHAQARRLAKRLLARTNARNRGTVTTNAAGRAVRGKRYIDLTIVEAGTVFFDGVAEIVALTRNLGTGGVTFSWIAADPNIDAWNPATEEGEPAPVGDRVAPEPLETPSIEDTTVQLDDTSTHARILIEASGPDRDDLTWYVRWRVTTDTIWNEQPYSDIDPGASVFLLTSLLPVDVSIDVEVAYSVGDGRVSDWSTLVSVSTSTDAVPPGPVTDFTVTPGGTGAATAGWTNPASLNLVAVRLYRNSTNTFGTATQVGTDIAVSGLGAPDSYGATGLAAGSTYFWMTTVSGAGAEGSPVAFGPVTIT